MPDAQPRESENGSDTCSQNQSTVRGPTRSLGWVLVICAVGALVYFPAVLTGTQSPWQLHGKLSGANIDESTDFETNQWDQLPIGQSFAGTPAIDVQTTNSFGTADLHVLVGSSGTGGNVYQLATVEGIPSEIDAGGNLRLTITGGEAWMVKPELPPLDGACCAAPEGFVEGGLFHTALTTPGFNSHEVAILPDPPYTVTASSLGTGSRISTDVERLEKILVGSTYSTTSNVLQVYTRPPSGNWNILTAVPCDSVFSNSHWGQVSNPNGSKTYVVCRNNGPVELTQIDLVSGLVDWTTQVDFLPTSPTGFTYQQADWPGPVKLPTGDSGDAVAFVSPSDTEVNVGLVAPVGGPNPPTFVQDVTLTGAVTDRQGFTAKGSMLTYYYPDPDGVGSITAVINCGNLSVPCTALTMEDNTRTPVWSAMPPNTYVGTNDTYWVVPDRAVVIEGSSSEVTISTIDTPFFYGNFESGDTSQYDNVSR